MANNLKRWKRNVSNQIPMLAPILAAASYVEDDNAGVGTFCVEPATLKVSYSPKFAATQTEMENSFVLAHEATHVLCQHMTRRAEMQAREGKSFNFPLWQLAEESAVNEVVEDLSGWKVPSGGFPVIKELAGLSTEERYAWLKQNTTVVRTPKACGCMRGQPGDKPDSATALLIHQITEQGRKAASQLMAGREAGNTPGELRRLAIAAAPLDQPPDFATLLKRFMTAAAMQCDAFDPATIYRRRLATDGLCVPNLAASPQARRFALSIDNSGSVGDAEWALLVGVLIEAAQQLGFQEVFVYHFTATVMARERYTNLRDLKKKVDRRATGGTCVVDADRHAAQDHVQFNIILTDGYVPWPSEYSVPTVVVRSTRDTKAEPARNLLADLELVEAA